MVQDLNQYVAIAEEFRNEATEKVKSGALMHDRKISRIVTPGTLIDESFMDPFTNNYILSIHVNVSNRLALHPKILPCQPDVVGLAWLDLSTGQFFLQSTSLDALASHLARICPREIILDDDLQDNEEQHEILSSLVEDQHIVRYQKSHELKQMASWVSMLESPIPAKNANKFASVEIAAGSALLNYVETQLQGSNMKLQPPIHQLEVMGIDKHTMRALEIKKTMRDDHLTGSLLKVVRRTVTKEGARLLDVWLSTYSPVELTKVSDCYKALHQHLLMLLIIDWILSPICSSRKTSANGSSCYFVEAMILIDSFKSLPLDEEILMIFSPSQAAFKQRTIFLKRFKGLNLTNVSHHYLPASTLTTLSSLQIVFAKPSTRRAFFSNIV